MTCIVGLVHKNKVWVGGDSAGVNARELKIRPRADEKVFKNGDFIIGIAGSFRMGNVLRYSLDIPKFSGKDVRKFMSNDFIEATRKAFVDGQVVSNSTEAFPGVFIVGYKDNLFTVQADYQVAVHENGFDAVGCGEAYALGALRSSTRRNPEKKVLEALMAAEEFSGGVQRPFRILHT